jgi:hypothetical protein
VRYLSIQAQDFPLSAVGAKSRRWLFAHPPTQIGVDVDVPVDAYFQVALGMDPAVWQAPLGDGVRFMATIASAAESGTAPPETVLLDHFLNPRAKGEQRRWVDVLADLRPWAGQRVHLTLKTEARTDPLYDWAGWGEPAIVRLDAVTADRLLRSAEGTEALVLRP